MNVRMVPPMVAMPIHRGFGCRIGSINRLNPEDAAYSANDAANHATNDAADNAANRSCCLDAHSGAMRDAVGDALCLRRKRASKGCGDYARAQNMELHATTLSFKTWGSPPAPKSRQLRGSSVASGHIKTNCDKRITLIMLRRDPSHRLLGLFLNRSFTTIFVHP